MALNYKEFKKDPVVYIAFIAIVGLTILFSKLDSHNVRMHKEDLEEIQHWRAKEVKQDSILEKRDSIIHKLYFALGMKAILDSAKTRAYE